MASILRIDTLQNLAGTTAATLDGNGMLSVAQRFKLPQFIKDFLALFIPVSLVYGAIILFIIWI